MAGELGLSLSMVYKWAEPPAQKSGAANPLDRVAELVKCSGDERIVQWLCQQAGGFFIKNPKVGRPHPAFLVPAMNDVVQEFADLLAVIADVGPRQPGDGARRQIHPGAVGGIEISDGGICAGLRRGRFPRHQAHRNGQKMKPE